MAGCYSFAFFVLYNIPYAVFLGNGCFGANDNAKLLVKLFMDLPTKKIANFGAVW